MVKQIFVYKCTRCGKEHTTEYEDDFLTFMLIHHKPHLPTGWIHTGYCSLYCADCADKIKDFLVKFDEEKKTRRQGDESRKGNTASKRENRG